MASERLATRPITEDDYDRPFTKRVQHYVKQDKNLLKRKLKKWHKKHDKHIKVRCELLAERQRLRDALLGISQQLNVNEARMDHVEYTMDAIKEAIDIQNGE